MTAPIQPGILATGRRKSATARVWLLEGGKGIVVNDKDFHDYFRREDLRMIILQPLELTRTLDQVGIRAKVEGGGESGQAGALRHGIARCLITYNPELRPPLRKGGFLTRDPREKERKKFGRKGARRSFQYTKR